MPTGPSRGSTGASVRQAVPTGPSCGGIGASARQAVPTGPLRWHRCVYNTGHVCFLPVVALVHQGTGHVHWPVPLLLPRSSSIHLKARPGSPPGSFLQPESLSGHPQSLMLHPGFSGLPFQCDYGPHWGQALRL